MSLVKARAAGRAEPAEHALGGGEAFLRSLPGDDEIAEHLDEVGAIQGQRYRLDAQADALHPRDVDAAGDLLGEGGQAFLGFGRARRGQGQARQQRLLASVERGQRMHQRFMVEELATIVVAEGCAMTQADAGGAGRGLGDQVAVEFHRDHATVEKLVEVVLQLQLQGGGRHRYLFLGCEQLMVQFVGDGDEMPRGFARGRPVARQGLVGCAEQRERMRGDLRRVPRTSSNCAASAQLRVDSTR